MDILKRYVYPIATLSGSIIGVGFLSLPYLTVAIGIWPMLVYFAVLTVFVVFMHLMFAEISLHTPDFKRFPGFVGHYLGSTLKNINVVTMVIGLLGILLVYLIIGSQFLSALLAPLWGNQPLLCLAIYFCLAAFFVYSGVQFISRFEFWAIIFLLGSLALIFLSGFSHISWANVTGLASNLHRGNWFLPYGAIVFSLWGTGLIPEVEEMLRDKRQARHLAEGKRHFKLIVVLGTLVPAVIYLAFMLLVLAISGSQTTESAMVGLQRFLGPGIVSIALLVGIVTTFTAFITQGLLLKKIFMFDLRMKEIPAWVVTCFVPLILFLLGINAFIPLLSFIGGVLLSIDGLLIVLMYVRIGGKKVIAYPLMAGFVFVAIFSLLT